MRSREWMADALCAKHPDPDLWHPNAVGPAQQKQIAQAASICMRCPVAVECDLYRQEIGAASGVWGGDVVRSPNGARPMVVQAHGTEAGYRRHRTRGEKPCAACRTAASAASRLRRDKWVRGA